MRGWATSLLMLRDHTHPVALLCTMISPSHRLHNTQQTQQTNILALSGMRTRDPSRVYCCSCLVCIVVVILCVFLVLCMHCCFFTLDAGLLARSQYSEGPTTGHLDSGLSWFPCVYKQMLRWFPTFQVASTCFSCSPPNLNVVVTDFMFCIHAK